MRFLYWYAVAPIVIVVGTLVFLTIPYLALAALAWAIVAVPYMLGRAINQRWHARGSASAQTMALSRAPVQSASRKP